MLISLIAAMDRNRVIGVDNRMPWHLPADLKHFKAVTWGKPILMGRRTFASLGRPLPGRHNIVLTRALGFEAAGVTVVHSVEEALVAAAGSLEGAPEVMAIGGAELYAQMLPRAGRLYLTRIDAELDGDAWFPALDPAQWRESQRQDFAPDAANPYSYSFVVLERC